MAVVTRRDGGDGWSNRAHEEREEGDKGEEENRRGVGAIRRHMYLYVGSSVLLIIAVGISSVLRAGGGLCAHSARVRSSHRRCLLNVRSAMVGLAVMLSGSAGVSAAECTASTCCNVVIPTLDPLKITKIVGSTSTGSSSYQCSTSELAAGTCGVCNQGK